MELKNRFIPVLAGQYDNPVFRTGRQTSQAGGIDSSESIPGLHKHLQSDITMHSPSWTRSSQFSSFQPRRGASDTTTDMIQTRQIIPLMLRAFRERM
jgi:hypothetical protein